MGGREGAGITRLGSANMTTAEEFARGRASAWRQILPMGDAFIRSANLGPIRIEPPLEGKSPRERHALIAEAAFAEFRRQWHDLGGVRVEDEDIESARQRIATILGEPPRSIGWLTAEERGEATSIAARIRGWVQDEANVGPPPLVVTVDPLFRGCGAIEPATGDILIGAQLVEVKAVGRAFRGTDLRQVLVYAALRHAGAGSPIHEVTLFNPRQGTALRWNVDELCNQAAGMPAAEVYRAILEASSAGDDYVG